MIWKKYYRHLFATVDHFTSAQHFDAGLFHLSFSQLQIASSANVSSGFHKKALSYIHLMKLHTRNLFFLVV